ncbi:hypothetical protein RFI_19694 [Reticulomyxa filosa]|uniref:Uncharacterized protein n=1 Tax=Reticulomyxa filosa TaxID=46433 RepID=X6MVE9_RETFI|nr:hypothetical protein RFI_19694 [Reticulomyxa filosa]|eukprot:ETO17626.1 hypothetical protein RFI_19694 [Reticulomyxa filosa]
MSDKTREEWEEAIETLNNEYKWTDFCESILQMSDEYMSIIQRSFEFRTVEDISKDDKFVTAAKAGRIASEIESDEKGNDDPLIGNVKSRLTQSTDEQHFEMGLDAPAFDDHLSSTLSPPQHLTGRFNSSLQFNAASSNKLMIPKSS